MVNRKTVENFLLHVESEYRPNAYHNNIHAADVTQTSAIIMESFSKHVGAVSKMDTFCIIMASAVHDLGHLGVNNDFLINSRHPRATTYNDKSVNESYHISRAFEIARTCRGCDIFEQFSFDEQKKVRWSRGGAERRSRGCAAMGAMGAMWRRWWLSSLLRSCGGLVMSVRQRLP